MEPWVHQLQQRCRNVRDVPWHFAFLREASVLRRPDDAHMSTGSGLSCMRQG
jgi:hypothetical protein